MKLFINGGNRGEPMGQATCELLRLWGFQGARISIPLYIPEDKLAAIIGELADNHLEGLFIVGGWEVWEPAHNEFGQEVGKRDAHNHTDVAKQAGVVSQMMRELGCIGYIECGNEPDITGNMDPQRFVDQCHASLQAVRNASQFQPFITGGVSNLSKRGGLKYLRKCLAKGLLTGEGNVFVGVHPYRTGLRPWEDFEGRPMAAILADVRNEAGPYAITELGWHTAENSRGRWPCKEKFSWTDNEIRDFAEWELDLALTEGAELYAWYSINDGATDDAIDRYGIRRFDTFNDAKPVVEAFVKWSPPL